MAERSEQPGSRRMVLKAGAAFTLAAAAPPFALPASAQPQDAELARLQTAERILLKNAIVLTLDRGLGDFADADVLIQGGKIRAVRPNIAADAAAVVDATNQIVIPGFFDTHCHSYQGLLRGALPNGLLDPDYNRDVQKTLTPAYSVEDAYTGVLLTALGMLAMGTTGVVDISQVSHTPAHSDACIRALKDAGIRAVYSFHRGAGPRAQYPQDLPRLQRTYFSSRDQLVTLAITANLNAPVYQLAREVGVPVVQHLVGTNLGPKVLALSHAGLLRPGDEFIHGLGIDDAAWRTIKDAGGHISICAAVDMSMGHGVPAIQDALDHGFRPSLSSDHGVTVAQDMFSIMRQTFTLQRMMALERARAADVNPPLLLTARDMLEFATMQGARCANLGDKCGTLTPGKDADLVILRGDSLDVWPLNNAYGTAVNLMTTGHVETVFVAGKVKKWRGALVGVDPARIRRMADDARDALFRRAGFAVALTG
jgi:5-methylthioadenosine/S-adenosylhomocysteine deaminase